jgi:hypothetical protein
MDLRDIGWEVTDSVHVSRVMGQWWAVVNTVMNYWGISSQAERLSVLKKDYVPLS